MNKGDKKLGLWALVGMVFSMTVGAGLYNIPQNLAAGAGPLGVAIGWVVTAVGMIFLVATFKILSDSRPDLDAGIYQYASEGFGNYAGFNIAWGYWLCTSFANVAYVVMLNDACGAFFPQLLRHGVATLAFGTGLIWMMYFVVASGIRTAKLLNNALALIKVVAIVLIVVLLVMNVKAGTFELNFSSDMAAGGDALWQQVKSTMLVTLWCFIGIEGAVMVAARAKRHSDVGRATVIGFLVSWLLYVLVSVLCFGVMARARLQGLADPSVAYVLRAICGEWAYYFVIAAVIVSLLGGFIAWTIVCAQCPYEAAVVKTFPKRFLHLNRHQMPTWGLFLSCVVMQVFLLLVLMADDVYMAALQITGMMILPAYFCSGAYLVKMALSRHERHMEGLALTARRVAVGCLCSLFCLWMIYAGGVELLAFTSIFYVAGTGIYLKARRERKKLGPLKFTTADVITLLIILGGLAASIALAVDGKLPL